MKAIMNFWDFDGTLSLSPLPETGKQIYQEKTGQVYPHIGWWSKLESLDDKIFDIQPNEETIKMFNDFYINQSFNTTIFNYVLTSRMSKFKTIIEKLCYKFDLYVMDIFCASNLTKAERIKQKIIDTKLISDKNVSKIIVNFFDDRQKEHDTFEPLKQWFIDNNIELNLIKIKSDGND
jgi:hypothetical protein